MMFNGLPESLIVEGLGWDARLVSPSPSLQMAGQSWNSSSSLQLVGRTLEDFAVEFGAHRLKKNPRFNGIS